MASSSSAAARLGFGQGGKLVCVVSHPVNDFTTSAIATTKHSLHLRAATDLTLFSLPINFRLPVLFGHPKSNPYNRKKDNRSTGYDVKLEQGYSLSSSFIVARPRLSATIERRSSAP